MNDLNTPDTIEDTSGFYRRDPNGDFQYAPNFVRAPDYKLYRGLRQTYSYPTDGGWVWFDNVHDAKTALIGGIVI